MRHNGFSLLYNKHLLVWTALQLCFIAAFAQTGGTAALKSAVDRYFTGYRPTGNYRPTSAMRADSLRVNDRERTLTVYAGEAFCAQPFTPAVVQRIYRELPQRLPQPYNAYRLVVMGRGGRELSEFVPNHLRGDGADASRLWGDREYKGNPWTTRLSRPYRISQGLEGRHLMINASHGRYYKYGAWRWQRPYLFCTTEDLLTQSFVYPYLIPTLERAGAVVYTARERDPQPACVIVDNDTPADLTALRYGEQAQEGETWTTVGAAGEGFAVPAAGMADSINPFRLGTTRGITATTRRSRLSSVTWTPRLDTAGRYAVYVSYATVPGSVSDAHYTVYHKGGRTQFRVNQQMGGGTWVYLGTFDFESGANRSGRVVLTNHSNYRGIVTADGVRFGGGRSQHTRGTVGVSGLPRFLEGARYNARWCGLNDSIYYRPESDNDYNDDIRSRSLLLNHVAGGSTYLPAREGLRVPIEMCLGVHSDAGHRPDGSIYGTLGICTTVKGDTLPTYPSGISRRASADLADALLSGVTDDMSRVWQTTWTRRELWDRNYGESRTPDVPSAILEMLSHQNFRDMTYAHDPLFRQTMARSIYKSILRFVTRQHGLGDCTVLPLAPHRFSARLDETEGKVTLRWSPTVDPLEPTAKPTAYVVYTRTADEDFDEGQRVERGTSVTLPVTPGLRYDFRVAAVNAGGESAPTEILSVYRARQSMGHVLLVNGFDRLSGPARICTTDSVGFLPERDYGVPDGYSVSITGRQVDFAPSAAGREGEGALGYSEHDIEGQYVGGNTFDYPAIHGAAIAACDRYSYSSASREAWLQGDVPSTDYAAIDLILGAQCDVPHNMRLFKTFDTTTRQSLTDYLRGGGRLLVSGCYVGSDMRSESERQFLGDVLRMRWAGTVREDICGKDSARCTTPAEEAIPSTPLHLSQGRETLTLRGLNLEIPIHVGTGSACYPIQSCDIVLPAHTAAFSAFVYPDGQSAGIAYAGEDYRVIATGFPLESIITPHQREQVMGALLQFLIGNR